MHEWRAQPWRTIYFAYQGLLTVFVRTPWLALTNLPRSRRPHPSWSLFKRVFLPILREWSEFGPIAEKTGNIIHCPTHHAILPGADFHALWLEPDPTLIIGRVKHYAAQAHVQPARIPGYWQTTSPDVDPHAPSAPGERVILFFHGGGFLSSSAHPHYLMGKHPRVHLQHVPRARRALAVEYRLTDISPLGRNPFPAALLDAITGLNHLLHVVGFALEDVVVIGDSAGANLALALARHLVENVKELHERLPNKFPSPTEVPSYSLVLLSPWGDLGTSHAGVESSTATSTHDYLVDPFQGPLWAASQTYPGPLGIEAASTNEWISPASKCVDPDFRGFPRTFIEVGDMERLLDVVRTLRDRMVRDLREGSAGVTYFEAKGAVHDHLLFPFDEPEDKAVLVAIGDWVGESDK
ncbi:Alpha/Beta hydrolase protein [Rhodofomes roseus]|uniref:Alpha/Beta hydrolase protein n=1 Tax=Rhodofomes roseus TaxID=34475 RepID=A0ABQ8K2A2_9APHY|nr:Alpha/Beta hydrolase protein [Rhodofomes roseus]KAH9830852.1 Alpha/Beta hydrolase protein [Rhodofomes roseus]